jgi:hypothetical protein
MIHRTSFVVTAIAASFVSLASQANPGVVYNDATGDIDPSIATGNGTLDLVSMEVSHTATDLVFALTVNGNLATTDWGKFMIGISNGSAGDTSVNGNGWGRPINMGSPTGGMTNWIGSWVDNGGGAENRSYGKGWSLVAATYNSNFGGFAIASGAQSTITYTVSMASLGLAQGNTFFFDAYSSGGGDGDSAVDALANPNFAISNWGGPYTSSSATGIYSYTIPAPGAIALLGVAGLALRGRSRKA